jgi:hypothetical protein
VPDRAVAEDDQTIQDFRHLVRNRLGQLGVAVLDARLADEETKGLVGRPDLGFPNLYSIKLAVQESRPWPGSMLQASATLPSCGVSRGQWIGRGRPWEKDGPRWR